VLEVLLIRKETIQYFHLLHLLAAVEAGLVLAQVVMVVLAVAVMEMLLIKQAALVILLQLQQVKAATEELEQEQMVAVAEARLRLVAAQLEALRQAAQVVLEQHLA
jgi:hypothetical protein